MTKAMQPSKMFETSPIISAVNSMKQKQNSTLNFNIQPRSLNPNSVLPQVKVGDVAETGLELETHFNNESNIGFFHDIQTSLERPSNSFN